MMVHVLSYPGGTGKTRELLGYVKQAPNNFLLVSDGARKVAMVREFALDEATADRILPFSSAEKFFALRGGQKPNIFVDDLDKILDVMVSDYGHLRGVSFTRPWRSS